MQVSFFTVVQKAEKLQNSVNQTQPDDNVRKAKFQVFTYSSV